MKVVKSTPPRKLSLKSNFWLDISLLLSLKVVRLWSDLWQIESDFYFFLKPSICNFVVVAWQSLQLPEEDGGLFIMLPSDVYFHIVIQIHYFLIFTSTGKRKQDPW